MDFYTIVVVIAILFLILSLTIIGIFMTKSKSEVPFPNYQNPCPDYWTMDGGKCVEHASINRLPRTIRVGGKVVTVIGTAPNTVTFATADTDNNTIDFAHAAWDTAYPGKTGICAKQKFANENNIVWDGVSNYNACV